MYMKRLLTISILLTLALAASAAVKKTSLKVLYVGGHSDLETFGEQVDSAENAKSIAARTAAWEQYLNEYFTTVKVMPAADYNYKLSNDYDVTIMDGEPQPLKPRIDVKDGQRFVRIIYPEYFPDDFDRPVITIAELGETLGRHNGLKTDWYCLCLDRWAYGMKTSHPIFKGPYKVNITLQEKPTPEGAHEFAQMIGETLPETTKMWEVNTRGYSENKGYKIGMVSRPWGFEDSPEAEWISGGLSSKSYDAMSLGRQANFFHWGFAGSPADMTDEVKPLFANTVVYMSKQAGQHVIARKMNENISTRIEAKEEAFRLTRECWEMYNKTIDKFNQQMKRMSDSLKTVKANGGTLSQMEEMYTQFQPQPVPPFEAWMQQRGGKLYEQFGMDEAAYAKYYAENTPYFYGTFGDYGLTLDEDARSLGIANNDMRLLDKAVLLWESGEDAAKGKRILQRYTLLRYDNPQQYKAWLTKYRRQLFFTESGGWLWLVNSQDKNMEGNDYGVLKYNEPPVEKKPEIQGRTDKQNPVLISSLINDMADGSKELLIRMVMHPGFHVYGYVSDQDPYIQTTFDIQLPEGWQKDGDMQLPPFTLYGTTGTTVYSGDVIFRQHLIGNGKGKAVVTVNYQTCDDHACLPPKDVVMDLDL